MRRGLLALGALAIACAQTTVQTPTRSLDRPSDVSLACALTDPDTNVTTMRPLADCNSDNPYAGITVDAGVYGTETTDAGTIVQQGTLLVLVSQTARGEVALASAGTLNLGPPTGGVDARGNPTRTFHTDNAQIISLDPSQPGFGFIPVGTNPEHIRTTADSCRAVTANRDSCDLSVIDVYSLVLKGTGDLKRSSFPSDEVTRVIPHAKGTPACPGPGCVPLGARPSWIEIAPATSSQGGYTCQPPGAYHAFVAFPACALIGEIDLTTGELVQALSVSDSGARVVDPAAVVCPAECAGLPTARDAGGTLGDGSTTLGDGGTGGDMARGTSSSDGGALRDGGLGDGSLPPLITASQAYPVSFAISIEAPGKGQSQMLIADAVADHLVRVTVDESAGADTFGTASLIPLEAAGGTEVVRVGPRLTDPEPGPALGPPAICNDDTQCPSGQHCTGQGGNCYPCVTDAQCGNGLVCSAHQCAPTIRYAYAIGRDGSVHVVDTDDAWECDTNPDGKLLSADPRYRLFDDNLQPANNPLHVEWALRCLRNDDPMKPPRSPIATGPGITMPSSSLPRDVAFASQPMPIVVPTGNAAIANPGLPIGNFVWSVDSAGRITAINVFDRCPQPNDPSLGSNTGLACDPSLYVPSENALPNSNGSHGAYYNFGHPVPVPTEVMPNRMRTGDARFQAITNLSDTGGSPRLAGEPIVASPSPLANVPNSNTAAMTIQYPIPALCNLFDNSIMVQGDMGVPQTNPVDGGTAFDVCGNTPASGFSRTVVFREPSDTRNETWSFDWEGLLVGTTRIGGVVTYDATTGEHSLVDRAATMCARTVLPGDKLFLDGCGSDSDCVVTEACYKDPGAQDPTHGICVSRDPSVQAKVNAGACAPWTRGLLRYRITQASNTTLVLDELPEPEHAVDTHDCTIGGDASECDDINVLAYVGGQAIVVPTSCLSVGGTGGRGQCLRACDPSAHADDPALACGAGYICSPSRYGGSRCLRAPMPPTDAGTASLCFAGNEIYEVHAGESFVVRGDTSGSQTNAHVDPATGLCVLPGPDGQHEQGSGLRIGRLPIDPGHQCANPAISLDPLPVDSPDPCLLPSPMTDPTVRFLRYSNAVFDTILVVPTIILEGAGQGTDGGMPLDGGAPPMLGNGAVFSRVPTEGTLMTFTVVGGYTPLGFQLGFDISAQLPRAAQGGPNGREIYVIDEGKQSDSTGLLGQVIRFYTDSQATDSNFVVR